MLSLPIDVEDIETVDCEVLLVLRSSSGLGK